MSQTKPKHLKAERRKHKRLIPMAVLSWALLWLTVGCTPRQADLPQDDDLVNQWQQNEAQFLDLIAACQPQPATSRLGDDYHNTDSVITPNSLNTFGTCPTHTPASSTMSSPLALGKILPSTQDLDLGTESSQGETFLLITHRTRQGTGWIEEAASSWTGGWVSWKSSILEQKGFIYVPDGNLTPLQTRLPAIQLSEEPLDQFTGRYRVTSQISGNSSCEVWRIRPIDPNWALFYHQARECPS